MYENKLYIIMSNVKERYQFVSCFALLVIIPSFSWFILVSKKRQCAAQVVVSLLIERLSDPRTSCVYKVVARHAFVSRAAAGTNFLFFWRLARNPSAVPPRAEDVSHHGANRRYAFCLILQSEKMYIITRQMSVQIYLFFILLSPSTKELNWSQTAYNIQNEYLIK